jgi:hypothetical protein
VAASRLLFSKEQKEMTSASPLRLSHPQVEGMLQVSKNIKTQVLLDRDEMDKLFETLGPFFICPVSAAVTPDQTFISKELFLEKYGTYVAALKEGKLADEAALKPLFSSIFSASSEALYAMEVPGKKLRIKATRPVIQLQAHHFFISTIDGRIHPMVLSKESISWGLQFSYPQIYQHPRTAQIAKVEVSDQFPSSALFVKLVRYLRAHSLPTPFWFRGQRINSPIRIGKKCLGWINRHPQLAAHGLKVGLYDN